MMKNPSVKLWVMMVLAVGLLCIFAGCTPTKYSEEDAARITAQGTVLLDQYLDTFPEGEIEDRKYAMEVGSESGYIYSGYYLSNVVRCDFKAGGEWYRLYVNLEDGQLYTNYRMFDLKEQIKRQLKPYCERYGFEGEYEIEEGTSGTDIEFYLTSHDVPVLRSKPTDVLVNMFDVVPAEYCGEDQDALADQYFKDMPLTEFNVTYTIEDTTTFMDPRIVLDYLSESGNYVRPEDIRSPLAIHEYVLNGKRGWGMDEVEPGSSVSCSVALGACPKPFDYYLPNGDVVYSWNCVMDITKGLDQAAFDLYRVDRRRENGMEILYSGQDAHVTAADLAAIPKEISLLDEKACEVIDWKEHEFPFEITENSITYLGTDAYYIPRHRFTTEPAITAATLYRGKNLTTNPDGTLTPAGTTNQGETTSQSGASNQGSVSGERLIVSVNEDGMWAFKLDNGTKPRSWYLFNEMQIIEFQ